MQAFVGRKILPQQLHCIVTMNKDYLINLHRLAEQASSDFQSALNDGTPDAELGKRAREWAQAELSLANYRDEQLALQSGKPVRDKRMD